MSNRGLKGSEKQLETTLHFGRMFYNLYSGDENYILEISIGTSLDGMKLPLEVFYNSLDSSLDSGFGNGVKPSLYADFTLSGTEIIQVKADGASYSYTYNDGKYYSTEDSSYIVYEDNTFKLHTDGYVCEYNGNSYHLFSKITYPDGRSLWTDADSSVTNVV